MKTLTFFLPLLALVSMLFFSACVKGGDDDPFEAPPFSATGNMEVAGQTYDLSTWIQGPATYSTQGKTLNVSLVKDNVGTVSFYVQEITSAEVKGTHTLTETGPNGGRAQIVMSSSSQNGAFASGNLIIEKNEELADPLLVGNYKLLSGSFTFEGETTNGEKINGSGTFKNAQAIFL